MRPNPAVSSDFPTFDAVPKIIKASLSWVAFTSTRSPLRAGPDEVKPFDPVAVPYEIPLSRNIRATAVNLEAPAAVAGEVIFDSVNFLDKMFHAISRRRCYRQPVQQDVKHRTLIRNGDQRFERPPACGSKVDSHRDFDHLFLKFPGVEVLTIAPESQRI